MTTKLTRQFNVRATAEVIDKLTELARRSGMSQSAVVKRLIDEASHTEKPVQFLRGTGDD